MSAVLQREPYSNDFWARLDPQRYARGWYCLGLASDYQDGKPHSVHAFGTRVVVFKGEDGQLRAMQAWCPHMGADLALGRVEGNAVVCRFHGWAFGDEGRCTSIPYAKRIPPKAKVQTWPVEVRNQLLFLWNDPEGGAPQRELLMPLLPQLDSGEWSEWAMNEWRIDNNCRELVDNLADVAHFGPVHGSSNVVYFANLFDNERATQIMVGRNERLGGESDYLSTVTTYFGPAVLVCHMRGASNGTPIESILLVTHVPVSPNAFTLRYGVLVRKIPGLDEEANRAVVANYVDLAVKAFVEDVEVWHNKIRIDKPLLCDGDGPIYQLREWYSQFYVDRAQLPGRTAPYTVEMELGLDVKPPIHHVFES